MARTVAADTSIMWRGGTVIAVLVCALLGAPTAASATTLAVGRAYAAPVRPAAGGTLQALGVRVVGVARGRLAVAWYADAGGRPGALLASGTLKRPAAGWRSVALAPATVTVAGGARAWVALLATGGPAAVATAGSCKGSWAAGARSVLPKRWPAGKAGSACPQLRVATAPAVAATAPAVPGDLGVLPAPVVTRAPVPGASAAPAAHAPAPPVPLPIDPAPLPDPTPVPIPDPVDTTAPDTTITAKPASSTTSTSASLSFTAGEPGATFQCKLDSASYASCTSPKAYSSLAVGSHTFSVRAKDAAGNVDATPATATWTITTPPDTTAPDTTITAAPVGSTTSSSASFSFTASESGATFQCKLDSGSYATCTSPKGYTSLAVGSHTFSVKATDAAGNADASPATATWTITAPADTTAPDTAITAQPAASTTATSASFSFTATESGATFQCKLDAGSYATCTSPKAYTSLAVGSHTFSVKATDAAGNTDASAATATWTITTPPPSPTLGSPAQAVVDAAKAVPLIRYGRQYSGGGMTNDAWNTGPSVVLAAASYAGNTTADGRLLVQLRDLIAGGNEPVANGGYPAQHERYGTATLAIARRTPRIWDQLTAAEQHKVDLVMEGMLFSSAFTTSDTNPYVSSGGQQRTLDGDTDVHRDWNPNYREGMLGGVVQAIAYFGPSATQSLLTGYDAAAFLADLRANGLTNLVDTFNYKVDNPSSVAPSASQVASAVHTFKYYGTTVADPMGLYWALADDTFGAQVTCGLNGGAGVATADGQAGMLVSGCSGLPNKGALGMALELDSIDGGGARSSAQYAYDGAKVDVVNAYVLAVSGQWAAGSANAGNAIARLGVGMPDLWYKLDRGYRGYAKGEAQWIYGAPSSDPYVYKSDNPNYGFAYNRSLWYDVLAPYLGL